MRMHTESEAGHQLLGKSLTSALAMSSSPADRVSSAADAMLKLSTSLPPSVSSQEVVSEYDSEDSNKSSLALNPLFNARQTRKQRQFIPEFKKDDQYWTKRKKNNEAAKRSREKRRINDIQMGQQILELTQRNELLQKEVDALKRKFGLPLDVVFSDSADEEAKEKKERSQTPPTQPADPAHLLPTTIAQQLVNVATARSNNINNNHPEKDLKSRVPYSLHVPTLTNALLMPTANSPTPVTRPTSKPNVIFGPYPPPLLPMETPFKKEGEPQIPQFARFVTQVESFPGTASSLEYQNVPIVQPRSPESNGSQSPPCLKISLSEVSDSHNDESSGEDVHPLNLSKKSAAAVSQVEEKPNGLKPNGATPATTTRRRQTRKGMPLKLWHKVSSYSDDQDLSEDNGNDLLVPVKREKKEVEAAPSEEPMEVAQASSEGGSGVGKRQRNNEAAKRCRVNRRAVNDLRIVQSNMLENENSMLKTELQSLTQEISSLKELLQKKQEAEAKGETFHPPPLEDVVPPSEHTSEPW